MTFAIETPLSHVRSTIDEPSSINKRRRRPTFSLHLDINITHSFCATSSQSTTPALSPAQTSTSISSPLDSLPPSPVTPAETTHQWSNEDGRSPTDRTPAFNFVAWAGHDVHHFAIPDSPDSSVEHAPVHASTGSGNKGHIIPYENHQPIFALHLLPQANFGGQNPISSVPQEGTDSEPPLSKRVKNDDSARVAPRLLRPRSRPRDEFERVMPDHIAPRELAGSLQLKGNSCPPFVVSANYRQLSDREVKEMKLGPHRRRYKCLMDGCDRLFSRKSNVENHIRTHLDDKPFVCSLSTCKSAFVRKGDLLRHEEIHRPRRVHTCSCGQTFSRNDALTKHIRKGICGPGARPVFSQ